jgi:hypothetical protein
MTRRVIPQRVLKRTHGHQNIVPTMAADDKEDMMAADDKDDTMAADDKDDMMN